MGGANTSSLVKIARILHGNIAHHTEVTNKERRIIRRDEFDKERRIPAVGASTEDVDIN